MTKKWLTRLLIGLTVLLATVACDRTQSADPLFAKTNAWQGDIPADAETVSPEEFKKGIDSGELVLVSAATLEAERQAKEKKYDANVAFLQSLSDKDPVTAALLKEAADAPDFEPDRSALVPGVETVVLYGLGTQIDNAAESARLAQSVDNALSDYTQTYALLPADLKTQAATPESLKGKPLDEVKAALAKLNELLGTMSNASLDGVRLETARIDIQPQAVNPGNGTDNDGVCAPTNYVSRYWFPLKNFVSPVKQQGKRGTCWAFTAIGVLESRERVQNNNPTNLSEQFLVNKVKQDWDSSDDVDGYWSEKALNTAVSKGQVFPSEAGWTYNPSLNRPDNSYTNSCKGEKGDYTGDCSDTAHQSNRVCTIVVFKFCSYQTVNYSGAGVGASGTIQVWKNGENFDLNRYRFLLSQGYELMASFPVYRGFMDDVKSDGVVSNYSQTQFKVFESNGKKETREIPGDYGGHAVQIVGFLSNDDLSQFGNTPNIGGGYFIVKNSWGCKAGDGGYYYVPADYVSRLFGSLSTLNFDTRRSDAWNREQAAPGGKDAPKIDIKSNPARVDLRVVTDLAKFFKVSHPVAKGVTLNVTSDKDGNLYNGPWSTDTGALVGPELKRSFASQGARTLTLVASYGSSQSQASFGVNVVNTPPAITLQNAGEAHQGEAYDLTALIKDINEANATKLCANTNWSVDAPDALSSSTGCQVKVTFGSTGNRQVRVTTQDSEGVTAAQTLNLNVLPPPENPYPRIVSAGVYSREFSGSGSFRSCSDRAVAGGATIDFREDGCTFSITQPAPKRYSAQVEVENPDGEALTFDWQVYVTVGDNETVINTTLGSSAATFTPYSPGNAIDVTNDCRIAATVNAPDPSRSKSLTVWTGKCTYYSTRLN